MSQVATQKKRRRRVNKRVLAEAFILRLNEKLDMAQLAERLNVNPKVLERRLEGYLNA